MHHTCQRLLVSGLTQVLTLQAVKSMVESLETKQMMPLAKSGYLCCARCCDSASSSAELQHW